MTDVFPDLHHSGAPYGSLYPSNCKEQISVAYTHSVATAARCKLENIVVDDETVDATIRQVATHGMYDKTAIDVQLKCSSSAEEEADSYKWRLKSGNYEDLRSPRRYNPIILILVVVPNDFKTWLAFEPDVLQLATKGYWTSLRDKEKITTDSTTIRIPKSNPFDIENLLGMMKRVGDGDMP